MAKMSTSEAYSLFEKSREFMLILDKSNNLLIHTIRNPNIPIPPIFSEPHEALGQAAYNNLHALSVSHENLGWLNKKIAISLIKDIKPRLEQYMSLLSILETRWQPISSGNKTDFYLILDQIEHTQNTGYIWQLVDFKITQQLEQISYLSCIRKLECDCLNNIYRPINRIFYEKNMGKGNQVLNTNLLGEWINATDSPNVEIIIFACRNR